MAKIKLRRLVLKKGFDVDIYSGRVQFQYVEANLPPDIMPIFKAAQIMCIFLFDALGFAAAPVAAAILLMENTFDGKYF